MNFKQMQDDVLTLAGRRNEAGEREVVKQHLTNAYQELCLRTRLLHTSATVTLATAGPDYSLANDFALTDLATLRRVAYTGVASYGTQSLSPIGLEAMLDRRSIAGQTPAWTQSYYLDGDDTLMLDPTPSIGETVTLYYVARPDPLDLDQDEPLGVPAEFHQVIVDGAIARAAKTPIVRQEYRAVFEQGLTRVRVWTVGRGGDEAPRARFGSRRRSPHFVDYYGGGYC